MPIRPFVYQERSQEQLAHRAQRRGINDWPSYTKEEYLTWRPGDGQNWIRILPATWDGASHYGLEIWVHYSVGPDNASVLCLRKMRNQKCACCDNLALIERQGTAEPEELKQLRPRPSVLTWILDRQDENKGPQLWAMPVTRVDQEIAAQSLNRQTGGYYVVEDPYNGYDIYIDKRGQGITTQYSVQIARDPTGVEPLWLDFIANNPVPDTLLWRDYNEVNAMLQGGIDDPGANYGGPPVGDPRFAPGPMQPPQRMMQPPQGAPQRMPAPQRGPVPQAPQRMAPQPARQAGPPQRAAMPPQRGGPPQRQPQQPQGAPQRAPMRRPIAQPAQAPQQPYYPPNPNPPRPPLHQPQYAPPQEYADPVYAPVGPNGEYPAPDAYAAEPQYYEGDPNDPQNYQQQPVYGSEPPAPTDDPRQRAEQLRASYEARQQGRR